MRIPYSKGYIKVDLPDTDSIKVLEPRYLEKVKSEEETILSAIENPTGKPNLAELVSQESIVNIVVDDITRPTPTSRILGSVMEILVRTGVKKGNIRIVFALGTHRKLSKQEQERLLGSQVFNEYKVTQHNPYQDLVKIEDSKNKENRFEVNKWVAKADLRVLIGVIKPHAFAGYTGGAKSILPGVSGFQAIKINHSYQFLAHPSAFIGVIEGNPVRADMENKARLLEPNFIVNAVLNKNNEIVAMVAGDIVEAHREGVAILDQMARVKVNSLADVVVAACPFPTDLNLYQASFGAMVAKSIVKKGGVIILVAHCPEGLGEKDFADMLTEYNSHQELLNTLSRPDFFKCGQWGVQGWAEILEVASVIMVSEGGIPESYYEKSSVQHVTSLEDAWWKAKAILKKKKIDAYILPEAPFTIPVTGE